MNTLQLSFYAISLGLCLLTICLLARRNRSHASTPSVLVLGLFSVLMFNEWMLFNPATELKSLWLSFVMFGSLLLAPALWLLAVRIVDDADSRTESMVKQQAALVLLGAVLLIPLASTVSPELSFTRPNAAFGFAKYISIHATMLLAAAVYVIQTAMVVRMGLSLLRQRERQNRVLFSSLHEPGSNVLKVMLLAVLANGGLSVVRVVYCWAFDDFAIVNTLIAACQASIMMATCFGLIVYAYEETPESRIQRDTIGRDFVPRKKYGKSGLTERQKLDLLNRLDGLMNEDKAYLQMDISLASLSEKMGESVHNVSQTINQSQYGSFYEMINSLRVEEAQRLLIQEPSKSVIEIAFDVGYQSKSTFNSAFKRFCNMSPTQYRRSTVLRPSNPIS